METSKKSKTTKFEAFKELYTTHCYECGNEFEKKKKPKILTSSANPCFQIQMCTQCAKYNAKSEEDRLLISKTSVKTLFKFSEEEINKLPCLNGSYFGTKTRKL